MTDEERDRIDVQNIYRHLSTVAATSMAQYLQPDDTLLIQLCQQFVAETVGQVYVEPVLHVVCRGYAEQAMSAVTVQDILSAISGMSQYYLRLPRQLAKKMDMIQRELGLRLTLSDQSDVVRYGWTLLSQPQIA